MLHFATHGLTEGQWGCAKSPPALVTSMGDAGSDGILSFNEIARLRLDANLVVLSACETASGLEPGRRRAPPGQEEAGNTLEGLVRAFLAANARAVLTTYWPISDEGESEALIEDFYRAARSGTIGDALRTAQTDADERRRKLAPDLLGRVLHRRRCQQAAAVGPGAGAAARRAGGTATRRAGLTFGANR